MPEAPRPADQYPLWATDAGASIATPNSGRREVGFEENDVADEAEFNWIQNRNGAWIQRLDASTIGPEVMGSSATWVESDFGFAPAAGLTHTTVPGVVWIDGRRCEFDATYLAEIGEDSHTFAASVTTTISVEPTNRRIDFRVGGAPPAGYTDVITVTTDGSGITAVAYLIGTGPTGGGVIAAPIRFSGLTLDVEKGPADVANFRFTVDGVSRWQWSHLGNEDLRLERMNTSGVSQGVVIGFPVGGGVSIHGRPSEIANAPASGPDVTFGQIGEDFGATVFFNAVGTIAFSRVANVEAAAISVSSADAMSLDCGGTEVVIDNASGAFNPATDNDILLGEPSNRWAVCYAFNVETSEVSAPGSTELRLGRDESVGDVTVRGDGSTPISAPWLRLQNHIGQAGGAFDGNSARTGFRVGQTNTNGTEDIILIGASDLSPSRAYYVEARIVGVEDADATDGYGRRIGAIYYNTDSTSLAFGGTVEDTGAAGGYGGWAGTASAGLSIDGSNNLVLRVSAADTTTRNWAVFLTFHDVDHAD